MAARGSAQTRQHTDPPRGLFGARGSGQAGLLLGVFLLAGGFLAVVAGTAGDRLTPSVQALATQYFDAVERKDLPAALATLAPSQRERWARWVEFQTGNHYRVEGLALRVQPVLERLRSGAEPGPTEATLTARITLESGQPWSRPGVTVVGLVWLDGHVYFAEPPFHPAGGPDG